MKMALAATTPAKAAATTLAVTAMAIAHTMDQATQVQAQALVQALVLVLVLVQALVQALVRRRVFRLPVALNHWQVPTVRTLAPRLAKSRRRMIMMIMMEPIETTTWSS